MKFSTTTIVAAVLVLASAIPALADYMQEQLQCITGNNCINTEDFCMEKCFNMSQTQYNEMAVCYNNCDDDNSSTCTQACDAQFEKIAGLSMNDLVHLSKAAMEIFSAIEVSSSALPSLTTASANAPSSSAHSSSSVVSSVSASSSTHPSASKMGSSVPSSNESSDSSEDDESSGAKALVVMPSTLISAALLTFYLQ
ncbi:hypothetical protein BJ085DRAFT_35067 [Dimargaris cristalligena]|uniref:Extracellular membrane protein CFEM domain-containing protein n=1 Tax=Dimargaris cristalligena TaxID=215637 RepID=A0A4P9ZQK4_9FUNG|nr:hypothetical protein BJ085DRAFT_35067 [Dimargaris cristalligena]|eukprot:RKP35637.1 hypothetical protein BJ085DRAFT_35067 [Dimargaris cristalligena]